ncbi:MAG TPA: hypothetical protein DCD97_04335 [Firmicutes bacterium]|jgi:hypothetical protein|nr:hypothetical protein [Bacillota bacterium]
MQTRNFCKALYGTSAVKAVSLGFVRSIDFSCFISFLKIGLFMFLTVFLGLSDSTLNAEAAGRTTFHVGSAYRVSVGTIVTIDVSIEDPQALDYCSFELEYDQDIVEVRRVSRGELLSADDIFDFDEHEDGIITVNWEKKDTGFIDDDGVLFRISFLALKEGSTELYVQNLDLSGEEMPYIIDGYISTSDSRDATGSLEISTSQYLPGANRGSSYSVTLRATGGTTPYRWSLAGGSSLPSGLTLSSSGTISGTPTCARGDYSATIRVTDYYGRTKSRTFTITVYEAGETPLSITTGATLSRGRKGSSYSVTLRATGGTTPYRWSLAGGSSLPSGLTLSSSGTISGTPASAGTFTFTARVTDARYARQEKEFSLTITGSGSISSSEEAVFKNLSITRSTMRLDLTPANMPYTMVVDRNINWIELTVDLFDASEYLRINGSDHYSGVSRTVSLSSGNNQVTIGVSHDGYYYHNYVLTIYRLP